MKVVATWCFVLLAASVAGAQDVDSSDTQVDNTARVTWRSEMMENRRLQEPPTPALENGAAEPQMDIAEQMMGGKDWTAGCPECVGQHHLGGLHGIPCPWHTRCNMPQHMPYVAEPKTYYYFRPYNYITIPWLQEEAVLQGASKANPYDTRVFEQVYAEFDAQGGSAEEISVPSARRTYSDSLDRYIQADGRTRVRIE